MHYFNRLLLSTILFGGFNAHAQFNAEWGFAIKGPTFEDGRTLAVDNQDNVYFAGIYRDTVDFDPNSGEFFLEAPSTISEMFIAKYDSAGAFSWAKDIGGSPNIIPETMVVDDTGNVYVAGNFKGTADFDPDTSSTYNVSAVSHFDIFLLKLDSLGNFVWLKHIGGNLNDEVKELFLDDAGNLYLTGHYQFNTDFDPGPGTFILTGTGYSYTFTLKLDHKGDFVWAKKQGSDNGGYEVRSVFVDDSGYVYTTGEFFGTGDFDPGAGTFNLTSTTYYPYDAFVSKLDSNGNFVWAKSFGGSNFVYGRSIVVDRAGGVYVAGDFQGTADFDPGIGSENHTSSGQHDAFFVKFNSSGDFQWVKTAGASSYDYGYSAAIDSSDNIYFSGTFTLTVDFNPGAEEYNLSTGNSWGVYFLTLDTAGTFVQAGAIGGTGYANNEYGQCLAVDNDGTVYTTGRHWGTVDLDPGSSMLSSTAIGFSTAILVKMRACKSVTDLYETEYESYTWMNTGATYTNSGTYSDTLINIAGCDSIVNLHLTIKNEASLHFDGTNDYGIVSTGGATLAGQFTVETWFYADELTSSVLINTRGPGAQEGTFDLQLVNNGTIHGDIGQGGGWNWLTTNADATNAYSAETWTHVAYVVTTAGYTIYVNGLEAASGVYSGNPAFLHSNQPNISLGADLFANYPFKGKLDEVRVWSSARTQAQIQDYMNCRLSDPDSLNDLVTYFNFDEGLPFGDNTGLPSLVDGSENEYPLTRYNFADMDSVSNFVDGAPFAQSSVSSNVDNNDVCPGTEMTFTASVSDVGANPDYQWIKNGANIIGEIDSTYITSSLIDGDSVYCMVIPSACLNTPIYSDTIIAVIRNIAYDTVTPTIQCDSFAWALTGETYTTTGLYNDTLTGANGCDSIVTLDLTVNYSNTGSQTEVVCDTYTWPANSQTYTTSGTYTATLTNAAGCDSVVTLNLTVNYSNTGTQTEIACDSYTWPANSQTYTASGTYTATLTNAAGCDSVVTLNLTVNYSNTGSQTEVVCDSFIWAANSMNYTSTGIYVDTLTNVSGCDSVVTLNLTVNYSNTGSQTEVVCDSFIWAANNVNYTTTGTYIDTLTNVAGCDSVVTLNLTVNYSNASLQTEVACDSFIWEANNMNYTTTGTYIDTLTNVAGCDSVLTLNLTVNYSNSGSQTEVACDGYTWQANNMTYNTSGIYIDTLTNATGCDSIVTLNLTVNYSNTGSQIEVACDSYTWSANNQEYTASGIYTATLTNEAGCDSVVELDLTINATPDNTLTQDGITLTANAVGAEYQWLNCEDGKSALSGETNSIFVAIENGTYAVEVTSVGCVDTSDCAEVTTVGLWKTPQPSGVTIFPNPTRSSFTVQFDATQTTFGVTIKSIAGQLIDVKSVSNANQASLELIQPAGIYLVEVTDARGRKGVFRLVKE